MWARDLGHDLGHDLGAEDVGDPQVVRVELLGPSKSQIRYVDLPLSSPKLRNLAIAIHNGKPFSRPGLTGILSQSEYNRVAKEMVRRGLARDLPGKRRELTAAGRAVLKKLLV